MNNNTTTAAAVEAAFDLADFFSCEHDNWEQRMRKAYDVGDFEEASNADAKACEALYEFEKAQNEAERLEAMLSAN